MADLGQAQTGVTKSTAKVCAVKSDDNSKMIYKTMGNGHNVPMVWTDNVTLSGTEVTIASGIKIHGMDLASYATVHATPLASMASNTYYVSKNEVTNVIKIVSTGSVSNIPFDVTYVLGAKDPDVASTYRCIDTVNKNVPSIGR